MCTHRANLAVPQREWPDLQRDWIVRVPASSANLGPAFDAVAIALDRHLEVTDRGAPTPETHPAVRAFRQSGGEGPLSVRVSFPGGRGLGYSGAARRGRPARRRRPARQRSAPRAAGSAARRLGAGGARRQRGRVGVRRHRRGGGRARRADPARAVPAVVVWIPDRETPTVSARRLLPEHVPFDDAVFNVAHTALLVAVLAAGDAGALRAATEDRLHQDRRLARVPTRVRRWTPRSRAAAWGAWLSGSGPSVAAFADAATADTVARLPDHRPRPRARDRRRGCDGFVNVHIVQPRSSSRTKAMKHGGTS